MIVALIAIIFGLTLLVWSADRFVDGAASTANYFGMPPLLIGMVIVGFGTSAPEMVVSALAALQGTPGIALGNAYGSNITNIALILGVTALINPITVQSQILRKELPLLALITAITVWQLWDGELTRFDAAILLTVFFGIMGWTIEKTIHSPVDPLQTNSSQINSENELEIHRTPLGNSIIWLVVGLIVLIISSRILVWGAVEIAHGLGISDTIVGLTVVAVGTSLPELASSIIAVRKGEYDIALGNVIGSNIFNTLVVVGIAGMIHPMPISPDILSRDILVMSALTIGLFLMGYGFRKPGRINRLEGSLLLACFLGYTTYLISSVF